MYTPGVCHAAAVLASIAIATLSGQAPIRTADSTLRGLTAADFQRVTRLADHVYAFAQTGGDLEVDLPREQAERLLFARGVPAG